MSKRKPKTQEAACTYCGFGLVTNDPRQCCERGKLDDAIAAIDQFESRQQFEELIKMKTRDMPQLFKIFMRHASGDVMAGQYVRQDVEMMWQGWLMRQATLPGGEI